MAQKAAKIPTFVWEGTDKRGEKVKGEAQAANVTMMKAELRRQGIQPKAVRKKSALAALGKGRKKITAGDIAVFSRQLATMMSAGVPLVQGLDIVGRGHENPAMRDLVMEIKTDVEGGSNLSESLGKHPRHFNELFCNLVQAGEAAGVLDTLLDKLATYLEKTESIKKKIKKALFYPTAVLVVAFAVTALLLYFVVPQFQSLFQGFGADLPVFTQFVVTLSDFMQANGLVILVVLVALGVGFVEAKKRSPKFVHFLDRVSLRIPVIGQILHKAAVARYARTLSTMFAAGVPLVDALESVSGATGNYVYSQAVLQMKEQVASGQQLQTSMRLTNLFPNMVIQMTAIGEESGSLDSMLAKVADFYEEEVDNLIDSLSSLLEPMIMVILGVLVGGLVVAMYLPIFQMGSVI
ncbi:type IV pilus assembly protein PilC [Natronocella acetinitrilica]|uniref:Type IV pilus assembly protein PilC n=1 Tax=Natronocella acetinitrilica TaxID=414046 RepID=A0AAE3G1K3_9GAMM|nr:type II secretion system F family protein [Natronocella acetinitrilica]MCP1673839.1 type IV pilus assembly protein PilC [Natronocella acetinitrilica]